MRHTLGILVATTALLLTAACGDDGPDTASDQPTEPEKSQPTQTPTQKPTQSSEVVAILSSSAAGGHASKAAVDVGTSAGIDRLVANLRGNALANQVRAKVAATDIPAGQRLMGAVVSVGCDVPTGVSVTGGAGGVHLQPMFTGERLPECLVPVTSIALVLVEA
jgi:hypothetical protein